MVLPSAVQYCTGTGCWYLVLVSLVQRYRTRRSAVLGTVLSGVVLVHNTYTSTVWVWYRRTRYQRTSRHWHESHDCRHSAGHSPKAHRPQATGHSPLWGDSHSSSPQAATASAATEPTHCSVLKYSELLLLKGGSRGCSITSMAAEFNVKSLTVSAVSCSVVSISVTVPPVSVVGTGSRHRLYKVNPFWWPAVLF